MIFTLAFFKGLGERAIKTFAQALVAIIGAGTVGILDVNWTEALSVAALAALVSALTSIGNADFVAGTPAQVLAPDVIAAMNDDPEAKQRFQDNMTAALFMGADEPRRETTEDNATSTGTGGDINYTFEPGAFDNAFPGVQTAAEIERVLTNLPQLARINPPAM